MSEIKREHVNAAARDWRAKNPDKSKGCYDRWVAKHPEKRKNIVLRHRYGITLKQYQELLENQGGLCAICRKVPNRPHVDHNHDTGSVRGILCGNCNWALGFVEENPTIMRNMLAYIIEKGGK